MLLKLQARDEDPVGEASKLDPESGPHHKGGCSQLNYHIHTPQNAVALTNIARTQDRSAHCTIYVVAPLHYLPCSCIAVAWSASNGDLTQQAFGRTDGRVILFEMSMTLSAHSQHTPSEPIPAYRFSISQKARIAETRYHS